MSHERKVAYLESYCKKFLSIGKILSHQSMRCTPIKVTFHYAELFIEQRDQNMEEKYWKEFPTICIICSFQGTGNRVANRNG